MKNLKLGAKKIYRAPRLVVYGDMARLTAGGLGSITELAAKNSSVNNLQ